MYRITFYKGITLSFFALCGLLTASASQASISEDGIWSDTELTEKRVTEERPIKPLQYRLIALDQGRLEMTMSRAPGIMETLQPVLLSIPTPDGEFERFEITQSQVMHPDLAARYPEIRAYKGVGFDNPSAWIRFEWTPSGFHALVRSDKGTFYIDPYAKGDTRRYMSYYRRHFIRNVKEMEPERPPLKERTEPVTEDIGSKTTRVVTTSPQLRTYRLALAATGEYTSKFGDANGALAEMVTAVNRVTGIFENEFAVGLQLIANTDSLVYTDAGSDPYTNNDVGAMLDQNQTNLDTVIGSANYDIGHVFSTGGGGFAHLKVPCRDGFKAKGVTGLSNPTGDPYYVDYVAHEMGHQMGAHHTFNSIVGSCGGNRDLATAFEPGSGSTIMAYAGICGADDVQSSSTTAGGNSDDYFHVGSIEEIVANISNTAPDSGGSCGDVTLVGTNTPPQANAGSGGFTIPASTPFQLTGSATDPDGTGSLTYTWEQYDTDPDPGTAGGAPTPATATGPMFRSREGSTNPTRYFPQLGDILSGTNGNTWEVLPSVSRTLTFQLTVRDNSGGVDSAQIGFSVDGSSGPFRVTSQNSAVSYQAGDAVEVTWEVANTTSAPVSCSGVDIRLSADGGQSFAYELASNTANDGSHTVSMPSVQTTTARILVACHNNIFLDIADSDIAVTIPGAYNCSGTAPVVSSKTFISGEEVTCTGTLSVSTSGMVTVSSGASVKFIAPIVNLNPGFSVANGATFNACTSTPCP